MLLFLLEVLITDDEVCSVEIWKTWLRKVQTPGKPDAQTSYLSQHVIWSHGPLQSQKGLSYLSIFVLEAAVWIWCKNNVIVVAYDDESTVSA